MLVELAVNCWNYQHRLNWMLCSILQQDADAPEILFNVSYAPNNGDPTTEKVCDFFKSNGLNIKETVMKDKAEVSCRGLIRNKQMAESEADWILFADCDMVYSSNFFSTLKNKAENEWKDIDKIITADRISLDIEYCTNYFREDKREYPCIVDNVADIVSEWPVFRISGRRVGPGNFQLANMKIIRERNIVYTHCCRDLWRSTRSDKHFRKNMGGIHPVKQLPKMYHLNHPRTGSEEQR